MYKPKWMSKKAFVEFVAKWQGNDGRIRCVTPECGISDPALLTIDHIVPRTAGGSDDVSNLQPLCALCNSRKCARPDEYWQRSLYFDRQLNTLRLRVSQLDFVYNSILERADQFCLPYSRINGKMFCFFQSVGAGKTIGMFCLPFALNDAALKAGPGRPRVDRMLIVTKDQTLRSQIVKELLSEPARFGLVTEPPRVVEVRRKDVLLTDNTPYDIAVMCPNMLWPQAMDCENGAGEVQYSWAPGIEQILNRHPIIVFDEMHFAHQSIRLLIGAARHSLVFGFTASPIDACGELLEDMIKVSVYSYHDAVVNDGSMKYIG